ncbi:hypothetical protein ATANTOWER_019963 [Ataeniobius toweri]|uniref:Uncharacterized protein n=1 Tax=Ataeniobius toweri TaxID=208326 RepID=A0ABU7AQ51_9TELE|nr:hypothetical protein [Ataeniobius toweri]
MFSLSHVSVKQRTADPRRSEFLPTQATEEPALQMPSVERQEDLHYEDVNFIKKPSCVSESSSRKQQETLYAQVRVCEPENRSAQTAESPGDLYSVVQKHC